MGNSLGSSGFFDDDDELKKALEEAQRMNTSLSKSTTNYRSRVNYSGDGFPNASHSIDGTSPLILVFGGVSDKESPDHRTGRSIYCYNLRSHEWKKLGKMPVPRQHHAACLLNNKVYITGGTNPLEKEGYERVATKTTYELDLETRKWKQKSSMKCCRSNHAMVAFYDMLHVFGGKDDTGRIISQVEVYMLEQNLWVSVGHMPVAAMGLAVTCFRNKIWLIGGLTAPDGRITEDSYLDTVFSYDPLTKKWKQRTFLLAPRCYTMATTVEDNIWLFGGAYGRKSYEDIMVRSTNCIQIFDSSTKTWKCIMSFDSPRHGSALVKIGSHVFILGGTGPNPWDTLDETCIINTKDKVIKYGKPMPEPLIGTAAVGICSPSCDIAISEVENEHSSQSNILSLESLQWCVDTECAAACLYEDSQIQHECSANTEAEKISRNAYSAYRTSTFESHQDVIKDIEVQDYCGRCQNSEDMLHENHDILKIIAESSSEEGENRSRTEKPVQWKSAARDEWNLDETAALKIEDTECELHANDSDTNIYGVDHQSGVLNFLEKKQEHDDEVFGQFDAKYDIEKWQERSPEQEFDDSFDSLSKSNEPTELSEERNFEIDDYTSDDDDERSVLKIATNYAQNVGDAENNSENGKSEELHPSYNVSNLEKSSVESSESTNFPSSSVENLPSDNHQYLQESGTESKQVLHNEEMNLEVLPKELTCSKTDLTAVDENYQKPVSELEVRETPPLQQDNEKVKETAEEDTDSAYLSGEKQVHFSEPDKRADVQMVNATEYDDSDDVMPNQISIASSLVLEEETSDISPILTESEDAEDHALNLMDPNLGLDRLSPTGNSPSNIMTTTWTHSMSSFSKVIAEGDCIQDTTFPTLLLIGGMTPKEAYNISQGRSLIRYHPAKKIWEFAGFMPEPRNYHAALLHKSCIYISGGFDPSAAVGFEQFASRTMLSYNLEDENWLFEPSMSQPRAYHAMAELEGSIYVIGGRDHKGRLLDAAERFDPETSTWQKISSLPQPCIGCAVVNFRGELWSIGGITKTTSGVNVLQSVCRYDPKKNSWEEHEKSLSTPRAFCAAAVVDDSIWLFGGCTAGKLLPLESLDSVEVLVAACPSPSWKTCPSMLSPRHAAAVAVLGQCAFIFGGMNSHIVGASSENEHYICDEMKRTPLPSFPVPITGTAAIMIPPKLTSLYSRKSMESLIKGLVLEA